MEDAYMAGLMDADGWIGIKRTKNLSGNTSYSPSAVLTNSDLKILYAVQKVFGGNLNEKTRKENWKQSFNLNFRTYELRNLLEHTQLYLVGKKEQASIVLEVLDKVIGKEIAFYRMKKLNRRGVDV